MKKKLLYTIIILFGLSINAPAQGILGWPNQSEQDVIISLHIPEGAQAPALVRYALQRNKRSIPSEADFQALYNEYLQFQQKKAQLSRLAFNPANPDAHLYAGYVGVLGGFLVSYEHFITERRALMIMQQGTPAEQQPRQPQAPRVPTFR